MHMYSLEHKKYLKKLKMNKILVSVCQVSIVTLFIIIWQILADYKLINTFISSSPKSFNTNNKTIIIAVIILIV